MIKDFIEQKVWSDSHSSVWKEIVSRFGQSEYDDETKRAAHMLTLKAEWDAKVYARTREAAYEQVKEQLDQLYHDMTAGKLDATGEWHKAIKAVKDATPKP